MPLHDREKLNKLEDLKTKLFNKDYKTRIERRDSFSRFRSRNLMDSWQKKEGEDEPIQEKFFMKTSIFKKFFIFSIIFFILALGYASYVFFGNNNTVSNDNINISVLSNAFTAGGEDYPLLLEITNKNSSPLLLADLVIEYPKNPDSTSSSDNEHLRLSLGTIPAGGIKDENVKLVFYGEQGSTRQIKISLEYRVEGSNAIFVKDKTYDISINSTPINLSIDAPADATSNQDITLNVKASLNSTKSISGVMLKVDYPIGFQFEKAVPAPSLGNNIWTLGDFAVGGERNIAITGKMIDVFDGEQKVFKVWAGSQSPDDNTLIDTVFNSSQQSVNIKKSSISARLLVNGVYQSSYAVDTKTPIEAQIQWANNLETKINNLVIQAKLSGTAFDPSGVSAGQGFYDSSKNMIVWDKNSQSQFGEVSPGDSGSVAFSLSPLSLFSASGGILSSPSISIDISITGSQSESGGTPTQLSSGESKTINIISDAGLSAKALYYSGPFTNTGPMPPKAGSKTTYTIIWSVSNTANNISKAQVRATIPSWVRFTNLFSPNSEDLSYNDTTKEIIWNIGNIKRGTGITDTGRNVSFQLEFTPSISQIGTMPVIINDATLTGHDDFANVDIVVNKTSLNTRLLSDPLFQDASSRVVK